MPRARVTTFRLEAPHQSESFTVPRPLSAEMKAEVARGVRTIFDAFGGVRMLKSNRAVYIKPNGIDSKPYSHTRPEVVEAVIRYWREVGARDVFLFENSTQSTHTRVVFQDAGYRDVCKRAGARPIFLDEHETVSLPFPGKKTVADGDAEGYDLGRMEVPDILAKTLVDERDANLYVDLPKLKTHSLAKVTLGVKNQWAFPIHSSRGLDHNFNLAHKIVDVLSYFRPDFTLIEGVEGTIHGHYPLLCKADECVKPFKLLIGSTNVVAADIVGAAVFGLRPEDVPHLQLAIERGLSEGVLSREDIQVEGALTSLENLDLLGDMPESGHYPTDLYPVFPADVNRVVGATLACKEGCVDNPLTMLQTLCHDHGGRGGWDLVMGKGHDDAVIDGLQGPVLLAGHCAIEEVSERLTARLGRGKVYHSGECNDLCATTEAMFHLTKVSPIKYSRSTSFKTLLALLAAKIKGSNARVPSLLSHRFKPV